jgi:tRNA(Arg) A34 adenosine deaminase TadA
MTDSDLAHLRHVIQIAANARAHGNHPFGGLLVDENGQVLLEAENTVVTERDVTGHAETNLVRKATKQFSTEQLAKCTMYASTEPCAMCAGATHWAGIGRVVFALSEEALYEIVGPSPEHLMLPCREVFAHTARTIAVEGPCVELDKEARAVHAGFWRA